MRIRNDKLTFPAGSLALLTAVLWGGNTVAIKVALAGIPPLALAGFRFLLGSLVVLVWALLLRVPLFLKRGEHLKLLALGALFTVQLYFLNAGTDRTLAGHAVVFISTHPFFTALFAHFFVAGDQLNRPKLLGMALSFAGVVLIFAESFATGTLRHVPGDAMILISSVLLGARLVTIKKLTQDIHPGKLLLWQSLVGIPFFFLLSLLFERTLVSRIDWSVAGGMLYQGLVVAGFCFIANASLLKRFRASGITAFAFFTPVFGVLISNLVLGEPLSAVLVLSVLLVGLGITIVNVAGARGRSFSSAGASPQASPRAGDAPSPRRTPGPKNPPDRPEGPGDRDS